MPILIPSILPSILYFDEFYTFTSVTLLLALYMLFGKACFSFYSFLRLLFLFLLKYLCFFYIESWVSVGDEIGFYRLLWYYVTFLWKMHRNDYLCQIGHKPSTEMILSNLKLMNNEFLEVNSRSMGQGFVLKCG